MGAWDHFPRLYSRWALGLSSIFPFSFFDISVTICCLLVSFSMARHIFALYFRFSFSQFNSHLHPARTAPPPTPSQFSSSSPSRNLATTLPSRRHGSIEFDISQVTSIQAGVASSSFSRPHAYPLADRIGALLRFPNPYQGKRRPDVSIN